MFTGYNFTLKRPLASFARDRKGVAAVEFAYIAPLLILALFGTIEVSRAVLMHKKFQRVSAMVGDLVSREQTVGTAPGGALQAINGMIINRGTSYRPNTYIPAGLIWGLNVLSPGIPFKDSGEYDNNNVKPRKVAVLMTDGENTLRYNAANGRHATLSGGAANQAKQIKQTNDDTVAICTYMKSKNIEIFTVAFMVDDPTAKSLLEGCATDSSHYYDATDSDALLAAFSGIGQSLRVVRLAR